MTPITLQQCVPVTVWGPVPTPQPVTVTLTVGAGAADATVEVSSQTGPRFSVAAGTTETKRVPGATKIAVHYQCPSAPSSSMDVSFSVV